MKAAHQVSCQTLRQAALTLGAALCAAPALAGGAGGPVVTSHTAHYRCDGNKRIEVTYVAYGQRGTTFAVLDYAGQEYGLAQALSASGARYAGLVGPQTPQGLGHGLEWWEWHGEATLSTFTSAGTESTRTLLSGCRPRR